MSQSSINAEVTANLDDVRIAIAQAEADGGRSKGAVTLIGVSKQQPDERVDAALTAGLRIFGENRVQEADSRWTPRPLPLSRNGTAPDRPAPNQQSKRCRADI
jgi:hypothetical protein